MMPKYQCVFPNKDILLHDHSGSIKIKQLTLIQVLVFNLQTIFKLGQLLH